MDGALALEDYARALEDRAAPCRIALGQAVGAILGAVRAR